MACEERVDFGRRVCGEPATHVDGNDGRNLCDRCGFARWRGPYFSSEAEAMAAWREAMEGQPDWHWLDEPGDRDEQQE